MSRPTYTLWPRSLTVAVVTGLARVLEALPHQARAMIGRQGVRSQLDAFASGGRAITVERFEPARQGRYPAVLLAHGLDGLDRTGNFYRRAARRLAAQGYVVLVLHYFGRTGTGRDQAQELLEPMQQFLDSRELPEPLFRQIDSLLESWCETLRDGVRHACSLPGVRRDRVALVGFSLGPSWRWRRPGAAGCP